MFNIEHVKLELCKNGVELLAYANTLKKLSTCKRRNVAAIFFSEYGYEWLVEAWGVNTVPLDMPSCYDEGCIIEPDPNDPEGRCVRTLHAEQMALAHLLKQGKSPIGLRLLVTCKPCKVCAKLISSWGVASLVHCGEEISGWELEMLKAANVVLHTTNNNLWNLYEMDNKSC